MRLSAEVELAWGPGVYTFGLKAKQIEELERACKEGIGRICIRTLQMDYTYTMLRETIRLGLIGGGTAPVTAAELVASYVDGQPINADKDPSSPLKTATAILKAVHFGWEDLPEAPKGEQEPRKGTDEQTSASTGPHS